MGLVRIWCEMQVREQKLALSQKLPFGGLRFLHFDDHVGGAKNLLGAVDHGCAGAFVLFV